MVEDSGTTIPTFQSWDVVVIDFASILEVLVKDVSLSLIWVVSLNWGTKSTVIIVRQILMHINAMAATGGGDAWGFELLNVLAQVTYGQLAMNEHFETH